MAVSIGSKLRLKDGATYYGIKKAQVVTVKRDPFKVAGLWCVRLEERPGVFLLDSFCEVDEIDLALAACGESLGELVSPVVEEFRDACAPVIDLLAEEAERIGIAIAAAHEKLHRKDRKGRQRFAAPRRRRRK